VQAGLSSDVAQVLAEQAKSRTSGNEDTMSVMREMVKAATDAQVRSETQARDMFKMGMDGTVGVAHGAGGKTDTGPSTSSSVPSQPDAVECSSCGRTNSARANYCVGCGQQLRT
jgi:hypothetical protein